MTEQGPLSDEELIEAAREIGLVEPEKAPAIVAAARELFARAEVKPTAANNDS